MQRVMMMAAALVAMTTAPPALAQIAGTGAAQTGDCPGDKGTLQDLVSEHAFTKGGTDHGNPSSLIVLDPIPLGSSGEHTRMHVGKAGNWTATVAIGEAGRCAADPDPGRHYNFGSSRWEGEARPLVSFHIASHRVYYPGERVARACTWYGPKVGDAKPTFNAYNAGWFTVRLYGTICDTSTTPSCTSFRPSGPVTPFDDGVFECSEANSGGYLATFAPGPNCGPATWPTRYLRDIGAPPYAEWCDFVVNAGG